MRTPLTTYSATGVVPFLPSGAIRPISIQVTRERSPRITIDESDVSPNGPTTMIGTCSKNGIISAAGTSASLLIRVSYTSPNLK